jgi:hypothetical protein
MEGSLSLEDDKVIRIMGPAIFGIATMLAAAGAINVVSIMAQSGPTVGDIIAFDTRRDAPLENNARLLVHRPDQYACVLDLNTIRQSGGSLVVEARMPGESRAFQLHWAGDRTSSDTADCGRMADLIVDHRDMDAIAMAAGGYGVGRKTSTLIASSAPF